MRKNICEIKLNISIVLNSALRKCLLYKEGGRNLYYIHILFNNNHVFGNALLHKEIINNDVFENASLLTFLLKIL